MVETAGPLLSQAWCCHCSAPSPRGHETARVAVGWPLQAIWLITVCPRKLWRQAKMLKLLQSLEPGSRSQIERLGDRQTSLHGAASSSSEKPPALLGNNCCDPIGAHSCFEFSCSSGTCRSGLVIRSWMRGRPHQLVLCKRQVVPAVCLTFACQQHTSTARQYIRCSVGSKTVHVGLTSHAG